MMRQESKETKERGTKDFPLGFYYVDSSHPRYNMPFHWHIETELIRVTQGSLVLKLEDDTFRLERNDLAFISSGILHGAVPSDSEYECIVFDSELIRHRNYLDDVFISNVLNHKVQPDAFFHPDDELMEIENGLFSAASCAGDWSPLAVCAYLRLFFAYCQKNRRYRENDFVMDNGFRRAGQMKAVLEYIGEHIGERLTLEELSRVAGLSSRYFCRFFREYTGRTCFDYMNFMKMEKAALMLRESGCTVSEASYAVGFEDASYFTRLFRRYMGQSPSAYRMSHAQDS